MISHVLVFVLLAAPSHANLNQARQTYSGCLSTLLKSNLKERVAPDAFETAISSACKAEEATFRNASVSIDVAVGIKRADAERDANIVLTDIVDNIKARYEDYVESNTEPR